MHYCDRNPEIVACFVPTAQSSARPFSQERAVVGHECPDNDVPLLMPPALELMDGLGYVKTLPAGT